MVIGITGSSGAGKSTVCNILNKKYNMSIIDCDKIAKKLLKNEPKYLLEIVEKFGNNILLENEVLNRKKLANIIYKDKEKRNDLNKCTFKYIKAEIKKEIEENKNKIMVIDAPLLFEAKLDEICNITIAIVSKNIQTQINRIIKRDNIEKQHALDRINAQKKNDFYIEKCDEIIVNDDEISKVEEQLENIISKIKQ